MSWIRTASGRRIDFLSPDPSQITLYDIVTSLSRVARFGGHSPMKIAQHVCEVASLMMMRATEQGMSPVEVAEAGLVGLVHDFPEYAICDVPTPLKRLIGELYDPIEARLLAVVVARFGLEGLMEKYDALLKWADHQAVVEEALRYGLDGAYISEITGEIETRPYEWVDPETPRYLSDFVWEDDEDRAYAVVASFVRLMVLAGRAANLTNATTGVPDTTLEKMESFRDTFLPLPAILNNGQVYL